MTYFTEPGPEAQRFFAEQGYAILTPRLSQAECAQLCGALDELLAAYARAQDMALEEYQAVISQWRDLWRVSPAFAGVLRDGRLWSAAAALMERRGARLLHDHVIAKPQGQSATVPWHQDYPYWPVDTPGGLSCWMPLEDVGPEGGCLEIVPRSHREGERPAVDFIRDAHPELDRHPERLRLPVSAGSVVVLHSLTWHRTGPNLDPGRRRAYITLWVPPEARYAPAHAGWHPTTEHVTVQPGQILNDDWFPCFGVLEDRAPPAETMHHQVSGEGLSMFTASQAIAAQVRGLLRAAGAEGELRGGLGALLASAAARDAVVAQCQRAGLVGEADEAELRGVVLRLHQCSEAYRLHRARNVYNEAYVRWWQLVGAHLAGGGTARP